MTKKLVKNSKPLVEAMNMRKKQGRCVRIKTCNHLKSMFVLIEQANVTRHQTRELGCLDHFEMTVLKK